MIDVKLILAKILRAVPLTIDERDALLTAMDKAELRRMVLLKPLESQANGRTFLEMALAELLKRGKTVFVKCAVNRK
jgi:hypothetical protein